MSPTATANTVHENLLVALEKLREAEGKAVLLFAEVLNQDLFKVLGYPSIHVYAQKALNFSHGKTWQFIRLAESLNDLPHLRESVESGKTTWTKARVVAAVATPRTEESWVHKAETRSRKDLEATVRLVREASRPSGGDGSSATIAERLQDTEVRELEELGRDIPVSKSFRFSAEQASRFDALVEAARKSGVKGSREDLLLAALEQLVGFAQVASGARGVRNSSRGNDDRPSDGFDRANRASHQVVVHACPKCNRGEVQANGARRKLSPTQMARILCDADVVEPGKRLRATIPPKARRDVLIRDNHECQVEGCKNTHFLEVHHQVPRSRGGKNEVSNLITVCSSCHRFLHDFPIAQDDNGVVRDISVPGYSTCKIACTEGWIRAAPV